MPENKEKETMNGIEGTPQETSTEAVEQTDEVELTEASDEEISAFLASAKNAEKSAKVARDSEEDSEPNSINDEDEVTTEENSETSDEESETKATIVSLEKRLADKEKWIQNRSREIGDLRGKLTKANEQILELRKQILEQDPTSQEALDLETQYKENKQELKKLNNEENIIKERFQSEKILSQVINPQDWDVDAMAKTLSNMYQGHMTPEYINAFKEDPLSFMSPTEIIGLHTAARAQKFVVLMYKRMKEMEGDLAKAKSKPAEILAETKKNLERGADVTSGNGGANRKIHKTYQPSDISGLSDDELQDIIKGGKIN